jgi:hypothetical protein
MANTDFRNDYGTGTVASDGFEGPLDGVVTASAGSTIGGVAITAQKKVVVDVVNGAAAGTFTMPAGAFVDHYYIETPTAIPGTPTNTNIRLGSAANGEQYVADVDAKAQGVIVATTLYPGRNPAETVHYTVASSGGTTASQDGTINLLVVYAVPV